MLAFPRALTKVHENPCLIKYVYFRPSLGKRVRGGGGSTTVKLCYERGLGRWMFKSMWIIKVEPDFDGICIIVLLSYIKHTLGKWFSDNFQMQQGVVKCLNNFVGGSKKGPSLVMSIARIKVAENMGFLYGYITRLNVLDDYKATTKIKIESLQKIKRGNINYYR